MRETNPRHLDSQLASCIGSLRPIHHLYAFDDALQASKLYEHDHSHHCSFGLFAILVIRPGDLFRNIHFPCCNHDDERVRREGAYVADLRQRLSQYTC